MIEEFYKKHIDIRKKLRNYRFLKLEDGNYIDFSSNDYLCLSKNKLLLHEAFVAANKFGVGATGSRLLSGNNAIYVELENIVAKCKNMEAAIIFNSGFQCNISVLSCLLDCKILKQKPIVFFDRLNHSSLYQAAFLSQAKLVRYSHNDAMHLEFLLKKHSEENAQRSKDPTNFISKNAPRFIVTETVFGMDGDIVCLQEIVDIAKKYNCFLYLDEAHATGVMGKNGYGLSTEVNLKGLQCLVMGTFSKAMGVSGAYVACSDVVKNYLVNFCSGFIYTTANSPMVIGAALRAWNLLPGLDAERKILRSNSLYLRESCKNIGLNIMNSCTNIVPIICKKDSMQIKKNLLAAGLKVSSVRPPTVPTERLRIALNCGHGKDDIDKLVNKLNDELIKL